MIQGSGLRWAAANTAVDTMIETTSPRIGRANQDPTFCRIQPRKKYSSAAAWNGVRTKTMSNKSIQWSGRAPCGESTKAEMPM